MLLRDEFCTKEKMLRRFGFGLNSREYINISDWNAFSKFFKRNYIYTSDSVILVKIQKCIINFSLNFCAINDIIRFRDFSYKVSKIQICMTDCIFEEECCFKGDNEPLNYSFFMDHLIFKKNLQFEKIEFKQDITFKNILCEGEICIMKCTFLGSFKLNYLFSNHIIGILNNDFKGTCWLDYVTIEGDKKYTLSINENLIHNLQLSFIKAPNLWFDENVVDRSVRLEQLDLGDITIDNLALEKGFLYVDEVHFQSIDRTTAQLIKREAYRANDSVIALEYKLIEMNEYRKEIFHWKTIWTWLLLILNKCSNNYGKSWIRGVGFTVSCWLFFFSLFVVLRDVVGCRPYLSATGYIKEAANYLWLLNGLSGALEENVNISWWLASLLVVVFMLGKIFIGYGMYQTVSAFRRFGK